MDEYGGIRREMKADWDKLREMRAIEGRWRQIKDNEGILEVSGAMGEHEGQCRKIGSIERRCRHKNGNEGIRAIM